jgi:8-oxo-dGTP diphosphatase
MYTYQYPRPALTVDCVIFGIDGSNLGQKYLLLIQRKHAPFAGCWALPGGFVDENESPDDAARRELYEETGVSTSEITQLYTFGRPNRDPRGWTVSIAYTAQIDYAVNQPVAADDASAAGWFALSELPENMAFDHQFIIDKAINTLFA